LVFYFSDNWILSWRSVVLIWHNTFFPEVKVSALALSVEPNNVMWVRFVFELVYQALEAETSLFFLENCFKSGKMLGSKD